MLELISVVALAAIGVAFTSYQGETESTSAARRSALDEADDRAEPVGIFGHDVGRRLRDRIRVFGARNPEVQEELDEADALARRLSRTMAAEEAAILRAPETVLPRDFAEEALLASEAGHGRELTEDGFEAPLEEAWASSLGDLVEELEAEEEGAATLAAEDLLPQEEPVARPQRPSLNAPVIHDFDPARDQIVLEYRPEEAGSGKVGIISDDRHPGAALITLGGKVVAIVEGGEGRVTAAHVELVQEDRPDHAAA